MREVAALLNNPQAQTLRTSNGVFDLVNADDHGQIQQTQTIEMTKRVQDIHAMFINKLLNRAEKTTNLTQRIKVRQLARDVSSRTLNKDVRNPIYRPLTDLSTKRVTNEELVFKSRNDIENKYKNAAKEVEFDNEQVVS